MPQAPAADQRRLLDVQDADTRIAQAQHRRAHLPVLAQIEELAKRRADLDEERVAGAIQVSDLRREVAKAEDDVEAVRARARRDSDRLNAGVGATPRELQALQGEVELLTKRQADLEEIEIEIMERLETAERAQASAAEQVDAIGTQIAELEAARDEEFEAIDAEIATLTREREVAVAGIDTDLLALYEKLRAHNGGIGAAALLHGQCQGCNMTLNPVDLSRIEAAPADEVVRCEECGRILVRGQK